MTRPPPNERPTLAEMQGKQPMQIAGKPADVCPYCGAGMFAHGVNRTDHEIVRYVKCRNAKCGKRFMSKQSPAKLVREVGADQDNSASGNCGLTLVSESA